MKKIFALALSVLMVLAVASCAKTEDINKKSEGVMTYAEYMAADLDSDVVIEGYVQGFAYNSQYGNVNMFIQDGEGGYYAYRAVCDEALSKKLAAGVKVKVTGKKAEWAGEVEIGEGCTFEVITGSYKAAAADVTSKLGTDGIADYQNQFVAVKGAEVCAALDGGQDAFLYNWDGSGMAGSNCDLYFNVAVGDNTFSFTVESDECPEGSDVYKKVTELKIGDEIDLEGFLYWYEGAQLHVSNITVK